MDKGSDEGQSVPAGAVPVHAGGVRGSRDLVVVKSPYGELVEPERMFDSYRWFMDELLAGLHAGFDGVAVPSTGRRRTT